MNTKLARCDWVRVLLEYRVPLSCGRSYARVRTPVSVSASSKRRNRHCPKCQGAAARGWLAECEAELLPALYYNVAFPLPTAIGDIAYQNKAVIYDLMRCGLIIRPAHSALVSATPVATSIATRKLRTKDSSRTFTSIRRCSPSI